MIRLQLWTMAALALGIAAAQAHAPSSSPLPELRPSVMAAPADPPSGQSALPAGTLRPATRPPPATVATTDLPPASPPAPAQSQDHAALPGSGLGSLLVGAAEAATPGLARLAMPATPRPLARPQTHAASARATVSASGPVASRLAVARSPLPERRSETARRRHLENLRQASAVRTQPVPPAITGQSGAGICGVPGLQGRTLAPITASLQGCGLANPVQVTAVDGVRLSQAATVDCDTARALHRWVREGLKPAIGQAGGGVVELRVAAHYACRTRNHRRGAPISEHGRGRAIDISGIRLADGQLLTVLRDWRSATWGPILRQAHRAACGTFSTTLGPGSDGMHEDHFHYDTARRNSRAICR